MGTIFLLNNLLHLVIVKYGVITHSLYLHSPSARENKKILRKIRAITYTENYGKLRIREVKTPPLLFSLASLNLYPFAAR